MSTVSATPRATSAGRAKTRALGVVGAVIAALIVWAIAKGTVTDLRQPSFGTSDPQQLSAGMVAIAALVGSIVGWALIALLERVTSRPRRAWSILAPLALVLSLGGPMSGHGVSAGNRLALVGMHLAVAAVVIPLFRRTAAGDGVRRD